MFSKQMDDWTMGTSDCRKSPSSASSASSTTELGVLRHINRFITFQRHARAMQQTQFPFLVRKRDAWNAG